MFPVGGEGGREAESIRLLQWMQNLAEGRFSRPHVGQFIVIWRRVLSLESGGLLGCRTAPRAILAKSRKLGNVELQQSAC